MGGALAGIGAGVGAAIAALTIWDRRTWGAGLGVVSWVAGGRRLAGFLALPAVAAFLPIVLAALLLPASP